MPNAPLSLVEELWVGVCHALRMKTSMQKQSQSDWDRTLEDTRHGERSTVSRGRREGFRSRRRARFFLTTE